MKRRTRSSACLTTGRAVSEAFSTKKFTTEEYENDKKHIIEKYNEKGYRDAVLVEDSVVNYNDKRVDIFLKVEEGDNIT